MLQQNPIKQLIESMDIGHITGQMLNWEGNFMEENTNNILIYFLKASSATHFDCQSRYTQWKRKYIHHSSDFNSSSHICVNVTSKEKKEQ